MANRHEEIQYPIDVQKLVAFSIIGYLEVLKRDGYADVDINFVFKPISTCKLLKQLKFDDTIIDALYQFDEIEALYAISERSVFEKSIDDLILPIIMFLKNARAASDNSKPAIELLLNYGDSAFY